MQKDLIEYLESYLTERRSGLIEKVLQDRTRYITLVLEDIFQSQNASAVMRTCDCFGIQDIHVIENKNQYEVSQDVTMGSTKWLNLKRYNSNENNTLEAIDKLRSDGYRIVATSPHAEDITIRDFDIEKGKVALFFGTELTGLSDIVMDNADEFVKVPMYGFTESYNISVCAALVLYELTQKLRKSDIDWKLTTEEHNDTKLEWYKRSVKHSDEIIERYLETKK